MDERTRMKMKIVMMNRWDIRTLFGITFADQWGHFTDQWMSPIVHSYSDWIDYPKGNPVLKGHSGSVYCAVISSDGYHLYSSGYDSAIIIHNLLNLTIVAQWQAHMGRVNTLDCHSNGRIVSGGSEGTIRIWHAHKHNLIHDIRDHYHGSVTAVRFNRKGDLIVSCSGLSKCFQVWSVDSGERTMVSLEHDDLVSAVQFIDDRIVIAAGDGFMKQWDSSERTEQYRFESDADQEIIGICLNCDGSLFASIETDGFTVIKWPEMKQVCEMDALCQSAIFHPLKPNLVAFNDYDYEDSQSDLIRVFDVETKELVLSFDGLTKNTIQDLCFTPDGTRLISVSDDSTARMWDVSQLLSL